MIREVRQYWLIRITILGTGLAMVVSLMIASIQLWPIVQRLFVPTTLACGCAVLSVTTPWWLTTVSLLVIIGTLALLAVFSTIFIGHLRRGRRQEQQLRRQSTGQSKNIAIRIIETSDRLALTIGFFRPSIYISRGLIEQLTDAECQAVLAHERAHQRANDPLVTALMQTISTVLCWLPGAQDWMSAAYSLREVAADAVATRGYRQTAALSSAFVKLSTVSTHPSISAFSPNRDRLEKLLDRQWTSSRRWWNWSVLLVVGVIAGSALVFSHIASAKSPSVPPAASVACHETIVMCQKQHGATSQLPQLCSHGRCITSEHFWSPLYAWTPAQ